MKRALLAVLMMVFLIPVAVFAKAGPFNAPTPVQTFHTDQANATPVPSQPVVASSPVAPVVRAAASNVNATPKATANKNATAENNELSTQISTLNQTSLLFQQTADRRLEVLSDKNKMLSDQLDKMAQAMMMLNQEVNTLNDKLVQFQAVVPHAANSSTEQYLQIGMPYALYGILAALIMIIIMMFARGGKKTKKTTPTLAVASKAADEGEYDFMSTDEAIPAKLDLARAYVAMEDYQAAKQVLSEVMKSGNQEQRQQAEQLLNNFKK